MFSLHPFIQIALDTGVPLQTLQFLLILPVVVTLVAFFRQVVGIQAFGIYAPSLITFAFLIVGAKYGVAIYISVIVIGMVARFLLKRLRMLYLSRVAMTLTLVSLALLFLLMFGASIQRTGFAAVAIVPLIIMIVLSEKFIATQIEKNTRTAILVAAQTLLISLITYFIASWPTLTLLLFAYPWLILLALPINFLIGRWTGLRLSEYYRFHSVLKEK